jgi:hypothetical protein
MKPSLIQYISARDWPLKVYFSLWATFGVVVALTLCQPTLTLFSDWKYFLLFAVSVLLAPALFFFLSLLFAVIFVVPFYRIADRINGAPFRIGDHVRILSGPHQGRLVKIYELWESRQQIRVDLDPNARKEVTDIFSYIEVCRDARANEKDIG